MFSLWSTEAKNCSSPPDVTSYFTQSKHYSQKELQKHIINSLFSTGLTAPLPGKRASSSILSILFEMFWKWTTVKYTTATPQRISNLVQLNHSMIILLFSNPLQTSRLHILLNMEDSYLYPTPCFLITHKTLIQSTLLCSEPRTNNSHESYKF